MQLGWCGYSCLRRDLLAPRQAPSQYYSILPDLNARIGGPLHWMPLKQLIPGCGTPLPGADAEEIRAHQSVYNYGENFAPLIKWANALPTTGRFQATIDNPFDQSLLKYPIPTLDVCILEATGQMGGAYAIDYVARLLHQQNPDIGFIVIDQDKSNASVMSKLRKWHLNIDERVVVTTNYLGRSRVFRHQIPTMTPHLTSTRLPASAEGNGIGYVGNDYQRREPMLRCLGAPDCHLWGTMKRRGPGATKEGLDALHPEEFIEKLKAAGCEYHGAFEPKANWKIEDVYRLYAAGMCITREDGYSVQYFGARQSEIARAGKLAFWDKRLAIGRPLGGEFCHIMDAAESMARLKYLQANKGYWEDLINYQWQAISHYTSTDRFADAHYLAALKLAQGPIKQTYDLNLYQDLMTAAGLQPWGVTS